MIKLSKFNSLFELIRTFSDEKLNESDRFNILLSNITNRLRYSELTGSLI